MPEKVAGFFTTGLVVGRRLVWQEEHFSRLATHAAYFGVSFDSNLLETELRRRFPDNNGPCRCRISYHRDTAQWEVTLVPFDGTTKKIRCRIVRVKHPLGCWKTFPRPDFGLAADEEAILVDAKSGRVYEGSYTNVFVEKNDVFFTPPADGTILEGICRKKFLNLLKYLDFKVYEEPFEISLLTEGRIFLTNALRGVMEGSLLE